MSDTDLRRTNPPAESDAGFLHIAEEPADQPAPEAHPDQTKPPTTQAAAERSSTNQGTVEHLAARRALPPLDVSSPAYKQRLAALRTEVTYIVTGVRWNGLPAEDAAEQLIPLLNVGPVQQWKTVLPPFLREIDRAGNLLPVWVKIIDRGDPSNLLPDANPADSLEGRARRFAILMLGYYKHGETIDQKEKSVGFSRQGSASKTAKIETVPAILERLAIDPNTSLYATQALVSMESRDGVQALLSALTQAEGWAKVDVVEALASLKLEHLQDVLLASALERVPGLENYVTTPLYRQLPLEKYLRADSTSGPYLATQAALVLGQILQSSVQSARSGTARPVAFERDLPSLFTTLFSEVRSHPTWQHALALHYFAQFVGYYWGEISKGVQFDPQIVDTINPCLPLMPELERWMNGQGRDLLLQTLNNEDGQAAPLQLIRILGDLREARAVPALLARLEAITMLQSRAHALEIDATSTALNRLGDARALTTMQQLVYRTVDVSRRASHAKRGQPLSPEDPDVPGSIVYAAFLRSTGQLGNRAQLDTVLMGYRDFDPYVRTQALEALKRLDARGEDPRSRQLIGEALNDPRDAVVRVALQLVAQYRNFDTIPQVRQIQQSRPALASAASDTLRQLGQV
jgi:HEAT repeat protein